MKEAEAERMKRGRSGEDEKKAKQRDFERGRSRGILKEAEAEREFERGRSREGLKEAEAERV
ncbi:hypothetical protein L6R29_03035 [Myxococcota bacterium]|nr:hypothetical protein [Myxococcota bacterium]